MSSSEVVKGVINQSYKQNRHEDDLNQPLSVQPWGSDSDKRRYFLVEGLDDTHFRVYRESNPAGFNRTWWSVAGGIEELRVLVDRLQTADGGPKAKKLAQKILAAIPRFEATEEKRKRREYRLMRKEQFKRPEPGFSMYEGRTRGKRMKYTYSDDEDFLSDSTNRRSARNTGTNTPAEPAGPVTTASGRQIKAPSRMTVDSSNNIVTTSPTAQENDAAATEESSAGPGGRPRRSAAVNHGTNGWASSSRNKSKGYSSMDDEMDDDEDPSEPELGDDEEEDHVPDGDSDEDEEEFDEGGDGDGDEEMADDDDLDDSPKSMVVKLKIPHKKDSDTNGGAVNFDAYRYKGGDPKSQPVHALDDKSKHSPPAERSEESISVATTTIKKRATPEPFDSTTTGPNDEKALRPPSTPVLSSLQSTSLAFRESPDKAHAMPKPVNVGTTE